MMCQQWVALLADSPGDPKPFLDVITSTYLQGTTHDDC